ncbi:MAG: hypothetical protein RJA19_1934, partial [Bacteroidota bacterium]
MGHLRTLGVWAALGLSLGSPSA